MKKLDFIYYHLLFVVVLVGFINMNIAIFSAFILMGWYVFKRLSEARSLGK